MKPPGKVGSFGGKLMGLVGELWMVKTLAEELEWRDSLSDPKWGDKHTDMFGDTWHRSPIDPGLWSKDRPLPSA